MVEFGQGNKCSRTNEGNSFLPKFSLLLSQFLHRQTATQASLSLSVEGLIELLLNWLFERWITLPTRKITTHWIARFGLDCSQSPIFPRDRSCRSLSSTGRHLGLLMRGKLGRVPNTRRYEPHYSYPPPLPTGILYSPQFRSHQETKMADDPSNLTIDIYDLTETSGL